MRREGFDHAVAIAGMVLQGLVVVQTVHVLWVRCYQLSPASVFVGEVYKATPIADINRPFWEVLVVAVVCLLLSALLFKQGKYWLVVAVTALLLIARYLLTDILRN